MMDQGSVVKIIYLDLYRSLGLTPKDLMRYNTPFVAFDGTIVTPTGQIQLPVMVGRREVLVDFIVVHAYSPYTT